MSYFRQLWPSTRQTPQTHTHTFTENSLGQPILTSMPAISSSLYSPGEDISHGMVDNRYCTSSKMNLQDLHKFCHLYSSLGISSALHSRRVYARMGQGINAWSKPSLPTEIQLYFVRLCMYETKPFHQAGQSPLCQG